MQEHFKEYLSMHVLCIYAYVDKVDNISYKNASKFGNELSLQIYLRKYEY